MSFVHLNDCSRFFSSHRYESILTFRHPLEKDNGNYTIRVLSGSHTTQFSFVIKVRGEINRKKSTVHIIQISNDWKFSMLLFCFQLLLDQWSYLPRLRWCCLMWTRWWCLFTHLLAWRVAEQRGWRGTCHLICLKKPRKTAVVCLSPRSPWTMQQACTLAPICASTAQTALMTQRKAASTSMYQVWSQQLLQCFRYFILFSA